MEKDIGIRDWVDRLSIKDRPCSDSLTWANNTGLTTMSGAWDALCEDYMTRGGAVWLGWLGARTLTVKERRCLIRDLLSVVKYDDSHVILDRVCAVPGLIDVVELLCSSIRNDHDFVDPIHLDLNSTTELCCVGFVRGMMGFIDDDYWLSFVVSDLFRCAGFYDILGNKKNMVLVFKRYNPFKEEAITHG